MPNLEDIVQKNDDGTISVTLTDGRVAIVGDLPASKQFMADSAKLSSLMGMRAVFAIQKIGDSPVDIANVVGYMRALDLLGEDSNNRGRVIDAFLLNFTQEATDEPTYIANGSDGTVDVKLTDDGAATLKRLSSRREAMADELSPEAAGMTVMETRALCALTSINGEPLTIATSADLTAALGRLGSGRNLDRISTAYRIKFMEDRRNVPNS